MTVSSIKAGSSRTGRLPAVVRRVPAFKAATARISRRRGTLNDLG